MAKQNDSEKEEKELDHAAPNVAVAPEATAEKDHRGTVNGKCIRQLGNVVRFPDFFLPFHIFLYNFPATTCSFFEGINEAQKIK